MINGDLGDRESVIDRFNLTLEIYASWKYGFKPTNIIATFKKFNFS